MLDQHGSYDSRMPKPATSQKLKQVGKMVSPKFPNKAKLVANKAKSKMLGNTGIRRGRARLIDNDNPTNPQAQGYGGAGIQDTERND